MQVTITDFGTQRLSTSITLRVVLLDVNDNEPTFNNPTPEVNLSELASPGTLAFNNTITDLDAGSNGELAFR